MDGGGLRAKEEPSSATALSHAGPLLLQGLSVSAQTNMAARVHGNTRVGRGFLTEGSMKGPLCNQPSGLIFISLAEA